MNVVRRSCRSASGYFHTKGYCSWLLCNRRSYTNDSEVRLIRDGIVVFEGKVDSLRRFKDEVKEVKTSFECGISLEGYRDIKEGDVIEAYLMEEIAPQL